MREASDPLEDMRAMARIAREDRDRIAEKCDRIAKAKDALVQSCAKLEAENARLTAERDAYRRGVYIALDDSEERDEGVLITTEAAAALSDLLGDDDSWIYSAPKALEESDE